MARLQCRPVLVTPLQVVAGFRESERGMSASGVRPVNAMAVWSFLWGSGLSIGNMSGPLLQGGEEWLSAQGRSLRGHCERHGANARNYN